MIKPTPIPPKPGQESVWDYPRPPRVEDTSKHIRVVFNGIEIVSTRRAKRLLETSHPPTYYIHPEDIAMQHFILNARQSICEWKGTARYYSLRMGNTEIPDVAWMYPAPVAAYAALANYVAIYAQKMQACYVDDELVVPQPGRFYGGWVTSDLAGPFKGEPGSDWW